MEHHNERKKSTQNFQKVYPNLMMLALSQNESMSSGSQILNYGKVGHISLPEKMVLVTYIWII